MEGVLWWSLEQATLSWVGACTRISQYIIIYVITWIWGLFPLKHGHSAPLLWFSLSPLPSTNTSQTERPGLAHAKWKINPWAGFLTHKPLMSSGNPPGAMLVSWLETGTSNLRWDKSLVGSLRLFKTLPVTGWGKIWHSRNCWLSSDTYHMPGGHLFPYFSHFYHSLLYVLTWQNVLITAELWQPFRLVVWFPKVRKFWFWDISLPQPITISGRTLGAKTGSDHWILSAFPFLSSSNTVVDAVLPRLSCSLQIY